MGRRVEEEGESECRSVIDRIRVEPPGDITLPEKGQTSLWSSVTREPWPTDSGRQADMSAAEMLAGAAPDVAPDWHSINWKTVYRNVRRLQARIVKAVREGRWNKVKALVYLLTHSFSGRALAILRVTTNQVHRLRAWTEPLEHAGSQVSRFQHSASARLSAATAPQCLHSQEQRQAPSLGIPTMTDRAMQALYLLGLDPIAETLADGHSYGFRLERCCADALDQCHEILRGPTVQAGSSKGISKPALIGSAITG